MSEQRSTSATPHMMKMERNLHFGCRNCFAPGEFRCETWVRDGYPEHKIAEMIRLDPTKEGKAHFFREGWPKVWVTMNDPKFGQAVGGKCPQCGHKRAAKPKKLETLNIFGRLF